MMTCCPDVGDLCVSVLLLTIPGKDFLCLVKRLNSHHIITNTDELPFFYASICQDKSS